MSAGQKGSDMTQGFYIVTSVVLQDYSGRKCEVDLELGFPIWERTSTLNPNIEYPERKDNPRYKWINYFNAVERRAAKEWGLEATKWIKANFKYIYTA